MCRIAFDMPSRSAVTISATANPSSIVAIRPKELVIGSALRGGVMVARHSAMVALRVRNLVTEHAGPSTMVSLLDPLYPLWHMRAKSNDT